MSDILYIALALDSLRLVQNTIIACFNVIFYAIHSAWNFSTVPKCLSTPTYYWITRTRKIYCIKPLTGSIKVKGYFLRNWKRREAAHCQTLNQHTKDHTFPGTNISIGEKILPVLVAITSHNRFPNRFQRNRLILIALLLSKLTNSLDTQSQNSKQKSAIS